MMMFLKLWRVVPPRTTIRTLATVSGHDPTKIRNIALVAHIDSGKTTLTESILLSSKYLSSAGSVDTGSTTTDFLPAERERGITIQAASIPVKWRDWTFNLVDTPGHADFGMEVESASRVVDGAVVLIDSVEGVEAQTKGVWKQLDRYNVPTRLMFFNKLDRPGASFTSSLLSLLSNRLHPKPVTLTLPVASFAPDNYSRAEPGIEGLVDLVKWEVWRWDKDGRTTQYNLPRSEHEVKQTDIFPESHPIVPHLIPARTALLENLSMFSEELMEQLLEMDSSPSHYLNMGSSSILPHLRKATLNGNILPVLCGSAIKNVGTQLAMDYVGELLANPLDVSTNDGSTNKLLMLAWKVSWDKRRGWMTFVRVYSGTLSRQSAILNKTRNQSERVSKLLLLYASQSEEVDTLPFGSVGVILGLKHTRTGDTLVSNHEPVKSSSLRDIIAPPAVMSASVTPQSHSDLALVQDALNSLVRTDPSVRVETQEGQMLVHGLGTLHLEIVEGRLRDEWGVRFEFGKRRVSYREGLGPGSQSKMDNWSTEIAGKTVVVTVQLSVRHVREDESGDPVWDGNIVVDSTGEPIGFPDFFPDYHQPMAHVARGLANALSSSPHTSLAHSNIHIQVEGFSYPKEVTPAVLSSATAVILRQHIRDAGMGPVMEPYMQLKVSVNEETLGKAVRDLTEHGGEVLSLASGLGASNQGDDVEPYSKDGVYIPPEWMSPSSGPSRPSEQSLPSLKRSVNAIAPLARMLDYSNRLRALSGGHGTFEMTTAGFHQVSETRKIEILKEIGRA